MKMQVEENIAKKYQVIDNDGISSRNTIKLQKI